MKLNSVKANLLCARMAYVNSLVIPSVVPRVFFFPFSFNPQKL